MEKKNLLIRASAGTGKTYSLATRCLWLLLVQHIKPATIVALTFSRAAAQEIYAAILKRLWEAAGSEKNAHEEAKRLAAPTLTRHDFQKALQALIHSQENGNIATIDSFILRLVCNYPLELGFQNAVEVIDDYQKQGGLEEASGKYLQSVTHETNTDLQSFISAFKACLKKDWPREVRSTLKELMSNDLRAYVAGRKTDQLPNEQEILEALDLTNVKSFADEPPAVASLVFSEVTDNDDVLEAFQDFKNQLESYTCEKILNNTKTAVAKVAFWNIVRGSSDESTIRYEKRSKEVSVELSSEIMRAIRADIARADKLFLIREIKETAQKLAVLKAIEKNYDRDMRRAGRLTFTDLAEFHEEIPFDQRLNIEYRFDLKFDHWALDEFQDTSCAQWGCLSSLVDNAAQDDTKSVMTVGDLKQAIYGWRGGSKEPFADVARWCAEGSEQWVDQNLQLSYRYQKNICEFVNRIFNRDNIGAHHLFKAIGEDAPEPDWLRDDFWKDHEAKTRSDSVKVIGVDSAAEIEEVEGLDPEASTAVQMLAKSVLDQIASCWTNVRKPGESVGVLVREQRQGLALATVLRRRGFPVVWEGKRGLRNAPIVELFLSPLVLAEHPEDSVAWELLRRSSLADSLPKAWTSAKTVSRLMSESLAQKGLARTLQENLDVFATHRDELSDVIRAAVTYENLGLSENGIDAFKDYLDTIQNSDVSSGSNQIRIMTIHHSKGLTLDHVFVPIFESDKASLFEMCKMPARGVLLSGVSHGKNWVFSDVTEKISACHPVLAEAWQRKQNDYISEVLNLYYVALTRARRSLTVILPLGVEGVSSLIADALPSNDAGWIKDRVYEVVATEEPQKKSSSDEVVAPQSFAMRTDADAEVAYKRKSPSGAFRRVAASEGVSTRNPFADDFGADAQAGIAQHAALEREDWSNPKDEHKWAAPADGWTEIWQEKAYELIENETWISGKIDRVTFYPDGRIVIADYKFSDKSDDELRSTYQKQMQDYVTAVRKLTGKTNISAELLVFSTKEFKHRVIPI